MTTAERAEVAQLIEGAVGSFGYQGHMAVHLTGAQLAVIVAALRDAAPASGDKFDFDAFERATDLMAMWLARFRSDDAEPTENDRLTAGHLAGALAANHLLAHGVTEWRPIETAPKDEMFIWAAPKGEGKWSLGLAYRNVSGGWSDAYGGCAPQRATHWMPLPDPPG